MGSLRVKLRSALLKCRVCDHQTPFRSWSDLQSIELGSAQRGECTETQRPEIEPSSHSRERCLVVHLTAKLHRTNFRICRWYGCLRTLASSAWLRQRLAIAK